jgi:hypothetical protein
MLELEKMLPITADKFADVTALVGYTVWQIQILERVLASHLVMVHKLQLGAARTEVESMFHKVGKQTLGQLFRAIENEGGAPAALLPRLKQFVDERNWLVHRSRHDNRKDIYTARPRLRLSQKISTIADEAFSLAKAFQEATEKHLIACGMSKADIDLRAQQIMRDWTGNV